MRRLVRTWIACACWLLVGSSVLACRTVRAANEPDFGPAVERAVDAYKWFHANPELSEQEERTAAYLADLLEALGLEVHRGIGGHGIVGILRNGAGPVVLYRADMDGLPVLERTDLPWASKHEGVMHACGHDVHMASAYGALMVLSEQRSRWKGTVVFVGQPAEEVGLGARRMLADPKFRAILEQTGMPRVALALHDAADLPAGHVALIPGHHHANVDTVDIKLFGRGGHGAKPNATVDPVVMGSAIVMSLQTVVSRRVRPGEPAVVTVGNFVAGTTHNIISSEATLKLTVRSYSEETRGLLLREIERIATHVARAYGAPKDAEVVVSPHAVPAAYNDPQWVERLTARFERELGPEHVGPHLPSLGGEDFGLFPRELGIPGVMWKLGAVDPVRFASVPKEDLPELHSDFFAAAPEPTMRAGIRSTVAALLLGLEE